METACKTCEHCKRVFDSGRIYCDKHVELLPPKNVWNQPRKHTTWSIHEPWMECGNYEKAVS